MRLINAHAIPWQMSEDLELYVTKETIMGLPTVDAAPVVHGRWVDKANHATCSACVTDCWSGGAMGYAFCPNCGAKMDGGGVDHE